MTTTAFVFLITLILGIVALVLFFLNRFYRYRAGLLLGALLMFAISVGLYLSNLSAQLDISSTEPLVADIPTLTQAEGRPSAPPVSPVSPVVAPVPTSAEVGVAVEFEGCLLFVSNRSGDFEIYKWQASIDGLEQLTNSPGLDIEPDWSPDGKQVVFASNREATAGFQMYVMNADGSEQRRLGDIQPGDNTHPSWSPDGNQIAFQSKRDTNANPQDDNLDIYVMNSDGSNVSPLITHSVDDSEPSWSSDGHKIAFLSERSGQDEVYIMNADGTGIEQLTELPVLKSGLNWSSDSRYIIFEGSGDVYAVDVKTKEIAPLISDSVSNEATPTWAQSDKFVVFSSDRTQNWELYLLDMSDSDKSTLYQITDDPGIDRTPDWSRCSR